jgi:hypothetical protein
MGGHWFLTELHHRAPTGQTKMKSFMLKFHITKLKLSLSDFPLKKKKIKRDKTANHHTG